MRVGLNQDTEGVKVTKWNNIAGDNTPSGSDDACDTDPNSLGCCQTKTISDPSDPCCTYEDIKNSNENCLKHETINITREIYKSLDCYKGIHNSGIKPHPGLKCSCDILVSVFYHNNSSYFSNFKMDAVVRGYAEGKIIDEYPYNTVSSWLANIPSLSTHLYGCTTNINNVNDFKYYRGSMIANAKYLINIDGVTGELKNGATLKTKSGIYTIKITDIVNDYNTHSFNIDSFLKSLGFVYP